MSNLRSISAPSLDTWHPSLFDLGRPELASGFDGLTRRDLPPDAWVDHVPGWLSGSAELFEIVLATMGWSHHVVTMYDKRVDQPRLTAVWKSEFNLGWEPGTELFEYVCQEANYAHTLMVGDKTSVDRTSTIVP